MFMVFRRPHLGYRAEQVLLDDKGLLLSGVRRESSRWKQIVVRAPWSGYGQRFQQVGSARRASILSPHLFREWLTWQCPPEPGCLSTDVPNCTFEVDPAKQGRSD
jgi:hypothetical protein